MTARARRLAELFERAVELPAPERGAWLAANCADDPDLRAEVAALLAADAGPTAAALEDALTPPPMSLPQVGDLVAGRYRIRRQIGAGGMGVVFEAEQQEPRRRVALKCIQPGWLDGSALARFRREAEALGRLQHPGIVPVFEAGVAPGQPPVPFLAMEFVDGRSLAEHADGLPMRQRLELLAAVGEAVAHAHQRGVVHRDLKPANVLVEAGTGGPRVRVLDFGVARFVGDDSGSVHTRTHQLIGTIAYMSPEQVAGGSAHADARSDVWSLGVTAFELLAGVLPLPLRQCGPAEAARLLAHDEPMRLERFVPALRGDVATIVHKALSREPAQRYADAGEFAADLRRHLADEPIAARPPSALHRTMRFARRHVGLVSGLGIAFVAMITGLWVSVAFATQASASRERADQRTAELRAMVRTLVQDIDRELADVAGTTAARRVMLETGLRHAEGMVADAGNDPRLLLEVASLYSVLAGVQGRAGLASIGDSTGALTTQRQALQLLDRGLAAAPDRADLHAARLRVLREIDSSLRAAGRDPERLANLDDQVATAATLARLQPGAPAQRRQLEMAANRGRYLADHGAVDQALPTYVALRDFLAAEVARTEDRDDHDNVRVLCLQIGNLHLRRGDRAAAAIEFERCVREAETLHGRYGDATSARRLADSLRNEAIHRVQNGQPAVALPALLRARELLAPLAAADRADIDLQRGRLVVEFGIGDALVKCERLAEGVPVLRSYLTDIAALADANPRQPRLARDLVPARHHLALVLARIGEFAEADALATAALTDTAQRLEAEPKSAEAADDWLLSLGVLGTLAERRAARPGLDTAQQQAAQAAVAAALQAHLDGARELERRGLLAPQRRSLLADLPPRLARLRGD